MRWWSVFKKSLRERVRNIWLLILEVSIGPFFVFVYYLMLFGGSTHYDVGIVDLDQDSAANAIIEQIEEVRYSDGTHMLHAKAYSTREEAEQALIERDVDAILILPEDFSESLGEIKLQDGRRAEILLVGDLTHTYYSIAAMLSGSVVENYVSEETGLTSPMKWSEEFLPGSEALSEFDMYVPGLLVFASVLLIYAAGMVTAREASEGTLQRLRITRMTSLDFLAGVSLVQILVGLLLTAFTLLTALLLGYNSQGPIFAAFVIAAFNCIGVIGIGLMVAAVSRTEMDAFLYGNFPLFLLMFITGSFFPLRAPIVFEIGGHGFGFSQLLPPTFAVDALNRILTHGAGLLDVGFEIVMLLLLGGVYFFLGAWLFQRRQLRLS